MPICLREATPNEEACRLNRHPGEWTGILLCAKPIGNLVCAYPLSPHPAWCSENLDQSKQYTRSKSKP